ncbi:MAG: hypothetical protein HW416_1198 [Chloroflexi bacterium]|nr:hypothetical protein [Chloroflexota bacterium]
MATSVRFTSKDLEAFPDNTKRYEIIDGELYVSKNPALPHQHVCMVLAAELHIWSVRTGAGFVYPTPGLVFAEDDDVIPDIVWVSKERLPLIVDDHGHFKAAPELIVEVLSPGAANQSRDRDAKLKLYSRQGVREYWIADAVLHAVSVYRREEAALHLARTLGDGEMLTSPLLPGFACRVETLWMPTLGS